MNLRTLKKLSKKAAPLLPLLGDDRKQFRAVRWDNYHHTFIGDRKHWERGPIHPSNEPFNRFGTKRGRGLKICTRKGRWVVIAPPNHPRKGTVMVGCMSGYYEPEWEEQTAWEALEDLVYGHFTDWDDFDHPKLSRVFAGTGDIFRAALEIIAERKAS